MLILDKTEELRQNEPNFKKKLNELELNILEQSLKKFATLLLNIFVQL